MEIDGKTVVVRCAKRADGTIGAFLIEAADESLLCPYPYWYMTAAGYVYTMRECGRFKWLTAVFMEKRPGFVIDHIDRCPMDNRRSNLRYLTHSDNMANTVARKHSKSGVKGLALCKSGLWRVRLAVDGKPMTFGYFRDRTDAVGIAVIAHLWSRPNLYPWFAEMTKDNGPDWVPGREPRRRAANGKFVEQRPEF